MPSVSAVTVTETTFFASDNNYTVFVDSMILINSTITNATIEFVGINSTGTNMTNVNATYDAVVNIIDLPIGSAIFNKNTSIYIFTSVAGNQSFNVTITPLNAIRIDNSAALASSPIVNDCSTTALLISAGYVIFTEFTAQTFLILLAVLILITIILVRGGSRLDEIVLVFASYFSLILIALVAVIVFNFVGLAC